MTSLLVLLPFRRWTGGQAEPEKPVRPSKRREILALIRREPGISMAEVLARLPYGSGTIYHHLAALADSGEIQNVLVGRRRLLYADAIDVKPGEITARSVLASPTRRRIARAIVAGPGSTVARLSIAVGDAPRVIYYHVTALHAAGLVTIDGRKFYRVHAAPMLRKLVEDLTDASDAWAPAPP